MIGFESECLKQTRGFRLGGDIIQWCHRNVMSGSSIWLHHVPEVHTYRTKDTWHTTIYNSSHSTCAPLLDSPCHSTFFFLFYSLFPFSEPGTKSLLLLVAVLCRISRCHQQTQLPTTTRLQRRENPEFLHFGWVSIFRLLRVRRV